MAQLTVEQWKALYGNTGTVFPNNTTGEISEGDMRTFGENAADTFLTVAAAEEVGGTTREFDRTWSSELLFDKNEIDYEQKTLTEDVTFSVATLGNLSNEFSTAVQRIQTDGTFAINFDGFHFISNISNGEVLEAGTYQVFFFYRNGIASVSLQLPSFEVANLVPLTTPGSFAAELGTDPDTEIDLSWTAVANASSLELQFSTTGGSGPWSAVIPLAGGATSYVHTGLTSGTTYHYRIRAIGDGVSFSNSNYATTAITTEDNSDVTDPTFTFSPLDAATDIPVNGVVIITADEPIRKADGTVLTDANVADVLTVKEDNGAGSDIPYTATIDAGKTVITITPNVVWPSLGDVFIQIDGVEDLNGNEPASPSDATFTTSDYTQAVNNYLNHGNILDSLFAANDAGFEFEFTAKDFIIGGTKLIFRKYTVDQPSFLYEQKDNHLTFRWYSPTGSPEPTGQRGIRFDDALLSIVSGAHTVLLKYLGSIDTGDGLDRVELWIDGVEFTTKTLTTVSGPAAFPFNIRPGTAPLLIGPVNAQVKDLIIRSAGGTVTEVNIPVMRSGLDVSGNNRHGVWV